MTTPVSPVPEPERPEPQTPSPAPSTEPLPGYDPGPGVRVVDPAPDGPSPEVPMEGGVRETPETPGDPGAH